MSLYIDSSLSSLSSVSNFHVIQKLGNTIPVIDQLGEGAYSQVFRVRRISDNAEYAMKKVKMMKLSDREKQNALNEVRILASIQHPNIIGYKEAFIEEATSTLCIIMEYADGGDLLKKISDLKKRNSYMPEKEVWQYFIQMVRGLKALHDLKICHRDIKCANVFLTKQGVIKLGDLNVSKVAKKGMLHTQTGTPYYASPEVWKDKPYDNRSDVWSLGCVLYEMAALLPPFRAANMTGLYNKVLKGIYDPLSTLYSKELHQMVKTCLQVSTLSRPSCDKILSMPILLQQLTATLERVDLLIDRGDLKLLNTIKVPKILGQISDRLPKPQYIKKQIRNRSLQLQHDQEILPTMSHKYSHLSLHDDKTVILPKAHSKRSILQSNEDTRLSLDFDNPRSAEPHLHKAKAYNLQSIQESIHESYTPLMQGKKAQNLSLEISISKENVVLPRIERQQLKEIHDIYLSKPLQNPDYLRVLTRNNIENIHPIYMSKGSDLDTKNQYQQQKKILQQVYGAYKVPQRRRDLNISEDQNCNRINPRLII